MAKGRGMAAGGGVLVTAFEPFGGRRVNASMAFAADVVRRAGRGPGVVPRLGMAVLPVDHWRAAEVLARLVVARRPSTLVLTGEWSGPGWRLETVGRPGVMVPWAGAVRRGRWPMGATLRAAQARGVSMRASGAAGLYVCDTTYWAGLGLAASRVGGPACPARVVFVHVPVLGPEAPRGAAARALAAILRRVRRAPGPRFSGAADAPRGRDFRARPTRPCSDPSARPTRPGP
ncbi:MAG: hypothetical protein AAF677_07395 [Pseudomonadota bacterium]